MYARKRAVGYTLSVHIYACQASVHALSPVFIPHTEREALRSYFTNKGSMGFVHNYTQSVAKIS